VSIHCYFYLFISFNGLINCEQAVKLNYELLLEGQFLDLFDEVDVTKKNGQKLDTVYRETAQLTEWYEVTKSLNTPSIKKQWQEIKNGSELLPKESKHTFYEMKLSEPVPFYGRYINNIILTSAGGILIPPSSSPNDSLMMPSFIAPFLTSMPPSDSDSVIFNDRLAQGGDFVVEWDRHFNNGEDNRLKMQLRLFLDGSLTFVYQKFHQSVIESISSKKYKVLIGLKDGFSEPVPESKTQDVRTYTYPSVLIPEFDLFEDQLRQSSWAIVTLAPKEGLCKNKDAKECTNECTLCQDTCFYNMELHRSGSPCNDQDECNKKCPLIHAPVCGSDGTTYDNQCTLQAKACAEKAEIHIMHEGECQDAVEKDDAINDSGENNPEDCGKCDDKSIDPICGSDNRTYVNECTLQWTNCKNGKKGDEKIVKTRHEACELNHLVFDTSDNEEEDEENIETNLVDKKTSTDNCFKKCNKMADPVCVNNHREYINSCQMEVLTCQDSIEKNVITKGHCPPEPCDSKGCPSDEDPICGSNDVTYRNLCLMLKVSCEQKLSLTATKGACEEKLDSEISTGAEENNLSKDNNEKSESETNEDLDKKCQPLCPRHLLPVCGTDGTTFNNECLLKAATCRDKSITKEHDGECQPEKAQMAAQHDEEISKSLKSKHGLEDHPIKAQGSRLGVATFVSICVVAALAYAVYHVRQRRSKNPATLPRYDFSVNEFRDVDPTIPSQSHNDTGRPNGTVASFPTSPTGISNPHSSENWRRPVNYDKANLVENMELNK